MSFPPSLLVHLFSSKCLLYCLFNSPCVLPVFLIYSSCLSGLFLVVCVTLVTSAFCCQFCCLPFSHLKFSNKKSFCCLPLCVSCVWVHFCISVTNGESIFFQVTIFFCTDQDLRSVHGFHSHCLAGSLSLSFSQSVIQQVTTDRVSHRLSSILALCLVLCQLSV